MLQYILHIHMIFLIISQIIQADEIAVSKRLYFATLQCQLSLKSKGESGQRE